MKNIIQSEIVSILLENGWRRIEKLHRDEIYESINSDKRYNAKYTERGVTRGRFYWGPPSKGLNQLIVDILPLGELQYDETTCMLIYRNYVAINIA